MVDVVAHADLAVVGSGLVGLATAYQAQQVAPRLRVVVVEKDDAIAKHQSSHNSGVLHAGVYYPPGSLKARLCGEGKRAMEQFAAQHGIEVSRNGKVVVAVDDDEIPRLNQLALNARANNVPGLTMLDARGLRQVEPHVAGVQALHSPETAAIDFSQVADALANEIRSGNGEVYLGASVHAVAQQGRNVRLGTSRGDVEASHVIFCGGLHADRLAALTGDANDIRVVPFRGRWYALSKQAAAMCRGNVYPVPDPRLPFLGVHASRRVDGTVWVGPNATLSGGRETYNGGIDIDDMRGLFSYPGFWRLARRYAFSGAREMLEDRVRRLYLKRLRRYIPDVSLPDLCERHSGIRAQAVDRSGHLIDDFVVRSRGHVTHVINAPSPAATSSLAIGKYLIQQLDIV